MPAGTTTIDNPNSEATAPTITWDPSPPAIPMTSAPPAATARTAAASPARLRTPRADAPPGAFVDDPEPFRLAPTGREVDEQDARLAARTGVPSVTRRFRARTEVPSTYTATATATTGTTDAHDDRQDPVALAVDHTDHPGDDGDDAHRRGDHTPRVDRGQRHPGASDRHDDDDQLAGNAQRLHDDAKHRRHEHGDHQQQGDERGEPLSEQSLQARRPSAARYKARSDGVEHIGAARPRQPTSSSRRRESTLAELVVLCFRIYGPSTPPSITPGDSPTSKASPERRARRLPEAEVGEPAGAGAGLDPCGRRCRRVVAGGAR